MDEIKALVAAKAKTINVAVIVPSKKRAEFWSDIANQTLTAENIEEGTDKLRKGHVGLTVFVGKYDGVDLPAKACELLVIDGLPELYGLLERIEQEALDGTRRQLVRQVQRIEQGMGRGVRSSQDHCVVLLVGAKLTQRLHRPDARALFSSATRAQLDLGREVTAQLKGKPLSEIETVMDLCLTGDDEWLDASRSAVVNADAGDASHVDETVVALRKAFDFARSKRFDLAEQTVQEAVRKVTEKKALGYLKQQLAEYVHHTDQTKAQEIQLAAVQANPALVRPISGIVYSKLSVPKDSQAAMAVTFMKRFLEANDLIMWVNALIETLAWGEENSKKFESTMFDLGLFLGFGSQRPEQDTGRGPDNLWALGSLQYLVIECKSGAVKATAINKHDCNQLTGSMTWFADKYDKSCSATPVMVHPKITPEHAATLHADARIITVECLARLVEAVRKYAVAISQKNGYADVKVVAAQLNHFGLTPNDLVTKFTVRFKKS
nr:helicase C-terminal domain-containing protein [Bradyrhizobium iriomotense]